MFSEEELQAKTVGGDRGAAIDGDGEQWTEDRFLLYPEEPDGEEGEGQEEVSTETLQATERIEQPAKTPARIARTFEYAKDVRKDVAHKATPLQKKAFDLLDDPVDGKGISQISRTRHYRGLFSISVCRKLGLMLTRWF